ncbi:MAG: hypothetical protein WC337_02850 [Candidatus Muiribacteriota bacterium]
MIYIKDLFENPNITIVRISITEFGLVGIDVIIQSPQDGKKTNFRGFCGLEYANQLSRKYFGKNVKDLDVFV